MNDDDLTTIWLGATRYYLGRMSYAVLDYCALLAQQWPTLPARAQYLIRRDLDEAIRRDDQARADRHDGPHPLGMDCDRAQWLRLRERIGG